MESFDRAAWSAAGAGRRAMGFGPHLIRITAAETGGRLGVFEAEVPPGEGPPPHVHEKEDEILQVAEGRFAFWCGSDHVELEVGGVLVVPRGAVHRFQNVGTSTGRLLCMVTPGGFEGFFAAVESEAPAGPAEIDALAARFKLRFVPALAAQVA
ncbi:cupin domain-containing protein [Mangrovicoccus sp. HB161399]|uniref:cupin domain-containing protein n=1 Tax=Mangrovicoccus sp. HB161399 TaxID=2720392 RepID=UPI001552790B|nr:cupin domain-containing protein [Mangrovicoccus sp. HB161399]